MNALDLLLLALLALAGITGYGRGFALQAFGFGGLLVGLFIGVLIAPAAAGLVDGLHARAGIAALLLFGIAGLGNAIGWLIGMRMRERVKPRFGRADAAAGSATAVLASLLAIWILSVNLVHGPFPTVASQIRGSAVVRALDATLPEPPSLLAQVRQLFSRFGFPDVFSGIPPLPADPVDPPTQEQALAAVEAGAASTVRVVGRACDQILEGSAFVVDPRYVVTAAHVVAGVADPLVQVPGAGSIAARTVLFDPGVDLAILLVERSAGPPLPLAAGTLERGAVGAILGYPEGGPLDGRRAAVRGTLSALGKDIYGQRQIDRLVIELQANVRSGNSGGPFVLADGLVGGVVFAASSTDPDVGYAIAAPEVRVAVNDAVGQTDEVDTGPCLR